MKLNVITLKKLYDTLPYDDQKMFIRLIYPHRINLIQLSTKDLNMLCSFIYDNYKLKTNSYLMDYHGLGIKQLNGNIDALAACSYYHEKRKEIIIDAEQYEYLELMNGLGHDNGRIRDGMLSVENVKLHLPCKLKEFAVALFKVKTYIVLKILLGLN